jgi:hypothetical protein
MPVVTTTEPVETTRIFASRPDGVDHKELQQLLKELARTGSVTTRDERLLEYLRELHVLSLEQIQRLLWPATQNRMVVYNRLSKLKQSHLLARARVPRAGMRDWGLPVCNVYALAAGGRMWLQDKVGSRQLNRHLIRDQVLHDLLVAEVAVRLIEATARRGQDWSFAWAGEREAAFYGKDGGDTPVIAPDGLGIVRRHGKTVKSLPFFLEVDASREAHGRLSSQWGRKVVGYNRYYGDGESWKQHPALGDLPAFPFVAVVTHGDRRLLNLAQAIAKHRKQPVVYYLALWDGLMANEDILDAPAWLVITADGKVIGQEREKRQPLLPPVGKKTG